MKQYASNQKKKIVLIINKIRNKKAQALKFNISIRSYYYWKNQLEETSKIENKKIINKVIEIRKKYKYGKMCNIFYLYHFRYYN